MLANDRGVRRGQLGARHFERRAGREAAEQLRHAVGAVGDHRRAEMVRAGHDVRDDFGVGRIRHGGLEHADDRRRARAETDRFADHGRVAVERRDPEPVREDRHSRRLRAIVLRVEEAAENGTKPHHVEERSGDDASPHNARLAAEPDHREVTVENSPNALMVVTRDFRSLTSGTENVMFVGADPRRALADVEQAIFVAIDERTKEHAADDAEDRGIGADAERERDHDGGGQSLRAQQRAQRRAACRSRARQPRRTSGCTRRAASLRGSRRRSRAPSGRRGARPPAPRRPRCALSR